jgi:hypothetical protein
MYGFNADRRMLVKILVQLIQAIYLSNYCNLLYHLSYK